MKLTPHQIALVVESTVAAIRNHLRAQLHALDVPATESISVPTAPQDGELRTAGGLSFAVSGNRLLLARLEDDSAGPPAAESWRSRSPLL